jgi:glyoxylase-like metal-dependent hydrolase (beta-lactamase superfamily II)
MSTESEDIIVPKKWYESLPRKSWEQFKKIETDHTWFEVYELPHDVYALYEPGQFQEVISYLTIGEEAAAIIDTGYGMGDIKGLAEELTDLPITVITTHTHVDHIAQNHQFDHVAVYDHQFARENAEIGKDHESVKGALDAGMVWKPLPPTFNPETWNIPPFKVTRWLKDGDVIDLGERHLETYHIPGHSPDSICILDRAARYLWTGDIFYNAPIYLYSDTTNINDFISSYEKMVNLFSHYDRLLPGHNETYVDKEILARVLKAAIEIRDGKIGEYREQHRRGTLIRRYDYKGFAIIVKAP